MITRCVDKPGSLRRIEENGEISIEVTQTIVSNTAADTAETIAKSSKVPREGRRFRTGWVTSSELTRIEPTVWENVVRYRVSPIYAPPTKPPEPNPKDKQPDPTKWRTEISWRDKAIATYPQFDATGQPYVNNVGDMLADRPPTEISHALLTLTRYQSDYGPSFMLRWANKVNSTTWYECPKYTAKCLGVEADLVWNEEMARYYWKVAYKFEIAPEGWNPLVVPNRGKYFLDRPVVESAATTGNGMARYGPEQRATCKDEFGETMSDGDFLDAKGKQLSRADVIAGNIHKLKFIQYETMDFNGLNLP